MEISIKLLPPRVPNYILCDGDMFSSDELPKISIAKLTDRQIEDLILEWGKSFREACKKRRKEEGVAHG